MVYVNFICISLFSTFGINRAVHIILQQFFINSMSISNIFIYIFVNIKYVNQKNSRKKTLHVKLCHHMYSFKNIFIDIKKYEKKEKIGSGSFGDVYATKEKGTNEIYAAKEMKSQIKKEIEQVNLLREVNLLSQMDHPSIIKFIGFSAINFKKKPNPVIITELMKNGSLADVITLEIKGQAPENWDLTRKLINLYGIASGMAFLHSQNVVHRDLKPGNVLEDDNYYPKISDFGYSKVIHSDASASYQSETSEKGTVIYNAPETFNTNNYSKSSDVYSFAILAFEVINGKNAYPNMNRYKIAEVVSKGFRPQFEPHVPKCYKDLIEFCWAEDPSQRLSFDQIVTEIKNNKDFHQNIDDELFDNYDKLLSNEKNIFFNNKKAFNLKNMKKQNQLNAKFGQHILNIQMNIMKRQNEDYIDSNFDYKAFIEELTKSKSFNNLSDELKNYIINKLNSKPSSLTKFDLDPEKIDLIYENNSIPRNFCDVMKFFDNVMISIKYPSDSFDNTMKAVYKLAKKVMNVTVTVTISGITSIDKKLSHNTIINIINLESPLEIIEDEAFLGCSSLYEVNLPETLKEIGNSAFSGCSMLNKISIPSSVKTIGSHAFNECISLTEITIPEYVETIKEYTFNQCILLKEVSFKKTTTKPVKFSLTTISAFAFSECKNLKTISIPKSVKTIGEYAFNECSSIAKISLNNVKEISNYCFNECSSLNTINIPSASSIGVGSFAGCSLIKKLAIPNSVENIGGYAFNNCFSLINFTIPTSINTINEYCFSGCESLIKISIPDSVTEIKGHAFDGCTHLIHVTIGPSVTKIGPYAFNDCNLKEISIPSSVTIIEKFSFGSCKYLYQITIPSSVTKICSFAFSECSSIEEISIPSSIEKIEENAFCGCSSLQQFSFPSPITEIDKNILSDCSSLTKVTIPSSVTLIDDNAFYDCSKLVEITMPSSLLSIGNWSFFNCSSLKEITIPSSVKYIGESAFSKCALLKQITIPSSITKIGKYAFSGCTSLVKISIPTSVVDLENGIFSGCLSLDDFVFHPSIKKIGGLAFRGCTSLKNVAIPPSITEIGEKPFFKCTSITELTIPSSLKIMAPHKTFGVDEKVAIKYS